MGVTRIGPAFLAVSLRDMFRDQKFGRSGCSLSFARRTFDGETWSRSDSTARETRFRMRPGRLSRAEAPVAPVSAFCHGPAIQESCPFKVGLVVDGRRQ